MDYRLDERKVKLGGGFLEDDAFVLGGVFQNLHFREENALDDQALVDEELVQFVFEGSFDIGAGVRNFFAVNLGENVADPGAGVRADDFADEIVADIFPKLGGIGFVDLKKDGALDTDAFVVFGGGQDRLIAESLLVVDIEAVADGVFENLGVKKLGDLPERNL